MGQPTLRGEPMKLMTVLKAIAFGVAGALIYDRVVKPRLDY